MPAPTHKEIKVVFEELRDAVRMLVVTDPERAYLYIRSATCSVEGWVRSLRDQRPGPSKPRPEPGVWS